MKEKPTSTSNIPIHPGFSWRRTGQKLLAGLLAALVAGSSMLSSMPVVMAKSLGVGEVIKEVISSDRFTVADGVTYEEALFKTEDGKTVAGFMLDTNYGTEGSNLHIAVGMPNNGTEFAMQRVSDQMRYAAIDGRNVLAGVNADFYNMSTGEPEGLVVKNGIQVHAWTPSAEISSRLPYRTFFGILKDGTAIIGDEEVYEANKANLEQAVAEIIFWWTTAYRFPLTREPTPPPCRIVPLLPIRAPVWEFARMVPFSLSAWTANARIPIPRD